MNIQEFQKKIDQFAKERNWDQFHSPKNLVMALTGEAAELIEIFQWLTEEQSKKITESSEGIRRVEEEIADVFIYLLRLADKLNIDIEEAVRKKLVKNAEKYPVELSKGNAIKYNMRNEE